MKKKPMPRGDISDIRGRKIGHLFDFELGPPAKHGQARVWCSDDRFPSSPRRLVRLNSLRVGDIRGLHAPARSGLGCNKKGGKNITRAEYNTVVGHYHFIFSTTGRAESSYKGMPFFDDWNPNKGGSYLAGMQWILENLGEKPKGASLHIIKHETGFVPGNLEWTHPKKQTNQQMHKIIAQQHHQIKSLKRQVIEAQQVLALAA